jgi:hypothetical protein
MVPLPQGCHSNISTSGSRVTGIASRSTVASPLPFVWPARVVEFIFSTSSFIRTKLLVFDAEGRVYDFESNRGRRKSEFDSGMSLAKHFPMHGQNVP